MSNNQATADTNHRCEDNQAIEQDPQTAELSFESGNPESVAFIVHTRLLRRNEVNRSTKSFRALAGRNSEPRGIPPSSEPALLTYGTKSCVDSSGRGATAMI
jgi:hypothetical protein